MSLQSLGISPHLSLLWGLISDDCQAILLLYYLNIVYVEVFVVINDGICRLKRLVISVILNVSWIELTGGDVPNSNVVRSNQEQMSFVDINGN